jgi:hypothetical protein
MCSFSLREIERSPFSCIHGFFPSWKFKRFRICGSFHENEMEMISARSDSAFLSSRSLRIQMRTYIQQADLIVKLTACIMHADAIQHIVH